jgi:hypothetical protein
MFIGQYGRIDFDDVVRPTFAGACNWRQRLENANFGEPQLTERRCAANLRYRGSHGRTARPWCSRNWTGRKRKHDEAK